MEREETKLVLKGAGEYDGEWPLDTTDGFSMGEHERIYELTGLWAAEYEAEFDRGNTRLLMAFAVVALERAGKENVDLDVLRRGFIPEMIGGEDAGEVPPAQTPPTGSSGNGSRTTSDEPADGPLPTGVRI